MEGQKVVLITGASSGIGRACAEHLGKEGYQVFGTSRTPEKIVWPKCYEWKGTLTPIQMDVNDSDSVKEAIKRVLREADDRLDVVVNNAGFGYAGSVEDTSIEEAKEQFETNFFGVDRVCQEIIPIMRAQGSGLIINISSLAGKVGLPFQAYYSASKYAVEGFTEALRIEVRPFGINAVLVEPGDIRTPFNESRQIAKGAMENDSVYKERFQKALGAQREAEKKGGSPEIVAQLICQIIKKESPKLRHAVGPSSFLVSLRRFVPDSLVESLVRKVYNL